MKIIVFVILLMILTLQIANAQQTTQPAEDPGVTPDSFLWGLDKALDNLNLLLTFNKGEKAKKGIEIAKERLLEVREMVEENKLEAAEKAKEEHGKTLLKVKNSVKELEKDDSLEEIEEVIEIEKELEEYDEEVEQTFGELKVKVKIEGEITQQQKDLIDSILNSLKGQTGEVEIEIKNKKDKTKIKIEQETGKSEEEIEIEIEELEKERGIKKQEKAFEAIEDAEEELNEFLEDVEEGIVVSQDLINQFNSLLEQAISEFDQGNFVEARRLAKQAEKLLDEEEEKLEEEKEIEVEIEEGKAKIKVEIGREKLKFELDIVDLDAIINEISTRTGLSKEEINAIMKVKIEEEEEIEIEAEVEGKKTKVKIKTGDDKQRFILDTVSEEEIIAEIVARTGLSEDIIKANLKFEAEEELNEEKEDEEEEQE